MAEASAKELEGRVLPLRGTGPAPRARVLGRRVRVILEQESQLQGQERLVVEAEPLPISRVAA